MVAKASLTRMQTFTDSGDLKVNEIKVRLDKLPSTLSKYESAQDELECLAEADYSLDREEFENQYYKVEARFLELLHLVVDTPFSRHSSTHLAACQGTTILHSHMVVALT